MAKKYNTVSYFQLTDFEGEPIGVLKVDGLNPDVYMERIKELRDEYVKDNEGNQDADGFAEFLVEKGYSAERLFLDNLQL